MYGIGESKLVDESRTGDWDPTSWAILDDSLAPPGVCPMPIDFCASRRLYVSASPRRPTVKCRRGGLPVATSLLQGRTAFKGGAAQDKVGVIGREGPLPTRTPASEGPWSREGGDPQGSPFCL